MGRHIQYGKYLIKHKWFVTLACFKEGLYWRGILHDLSKFRPSEWFPYANHFYEKDGSKKGYTEDAKFDYAWLLHQKRNKHHWQYWGLLSDNGIFNYLHMPIQYRKEMLCDWLGIKRTLGIKDWWNAKPWYIDNKANIKLHPETRLMLEAELNAREMPSLRRK